MNEQKKTDQDDPTLARIEEFMKKLTDEYSLEYSGARRTGANSIYASFRTFGKTTLEFVRYHCRRNWLPFPTDIMYETEQPPTGSIHVTLQWEMEDI